MLLVKGTNNVYLHQQNSQVKAAPQQSKSVMDVVWVELVVT